LPAPPGGRIYPGIALKLKRACRLVETGYQFLLVFRWQPGQSRLQIEGVTVSMRIRRFGVAQTAKILGLLYAFMGLLLIPIFLYLNTFSPEGGFGPLFLLAVPLLYGLLGFIMTAIGCALYNLVASWVGGIEVQLDEQAPESV
jgi:hypothetical protein